MASLQAPRVERAVRGLLGSRARGGCDSPLTSRQRGRAQPRAHSSEYREARRTSRATRLVTRAVSEDSVEREHDEALGSLARLGWRVLRLDAELVLGAPEEALARVRDALAG